MLGILGILRAVSRLGRALQEWWERGSFIPKAVRRVLKARESSLPNPEEREPLAETATVYYSTTRSGGWK